MTKQGSFSARYESVLGIKLYDYQKCVIDAVEEANLSGKKIVISVSRRGMATIKRLYNQFHAAA